MTTTVLLVDDHEIFRKGLRFLLAEAADLRVVGEAGDGQAAIDLVEKLAPDVVVMDISMPDVDGIEATQQIVSSSPNTRVIAMSIHGDGRFVEEMLKAGALGYVLKESAPEELMDGIHAVAQNKIYLSAAIQDVVISQYMHQLSDEPGPTPNSGADGSGTTPILLTKLHRPPFHAKNVHRPRLLKQLDAEWDRPLTLVSASAGYGKSTLVSQWLESNDHPSAWLSLDESDNDLRTFLSYVIAAIEAVLPLLLPKTSSLLQASSLPPTRVLGGTLINELEQAPERFILVLDDFHNTVEPGIHDLVSELLRYPSQTLHLVLVTRVDPALDLLQLRSYRRINEIRARELNFTADETTVYLEYLLGKPVDEAMAIALTAKTEGWPTGLHLLTFSVRDDSDLNDLLITLPGERQTLDYLTAEALSRQPREIQSWLLKTSVLNRFCAPLCAAICEETAESQEERLQGDQFIRWLSENNLFLVPLDQSGQWFRYHHLFQELLYRTLDQTLTIVEIDQLRVRASRWFADNNLLDEAIEYALAAHDIDYAVHLVLQHRYALMDAEQWNRLNRWITSLPADTVARNPLLLSSLAYIHAFDGQFDVAIGYCEQVAALLAIDALDEMERETVQGEIAVLQGVQSVLSGDAEHAYSGIQNALTSIPTTARHIRSYATIALAFAMQSMGRTDEAVALVEEKPNERGRVLNVDQATSKWHLCLIQALNGDLTDSQRSAQRCISLSTEAALRSPLTTGQYFLGAIHYLRNELTLAEPFLIALFEDRYSARTGYVAQGTFLLALLYTAQGRAEDAVQVVDQLIASTLETRRPQSTAIARAFQVELASRHGRNTEAVRLGAQVNFDQFSLAWFFYIPQFTEVKLLLAQNTPESLAQAGDKLDALEAFLRTNHRKSLLIDLLALQALRYHAQGTERVAVATLTEALNLASPNGALRNFVDLGQPMADLLRKMQDQPIDADLVGFCNQILSAMVSPTASQKKAEKNREYDSLTERELQTLRLLATELSTEEIAEQLVVAVGTVRTHGKSIYSKLNVHSRFEAVSRAQSLGII